MGEERRRTLRNVRARARASRVAPERSVLAATPVHFRRIERATGVRATVARLSNPATQKVEITVDRVRAPYWVDLGLRLESGFVPLTGRKLALEPGVDLEIDVRLDTSHPEFPAGRTTEDLVLELSPGGEPLVVKLYLDEVVKAPRPYEGVVAIDFGTASTVYALKDDDSFGVPRGSVEIPSAIFFHDLTDPEAPRVSIGAEAEQEIAARTHLVACYHTSLKRMLGGPPVRVLDPAGKAAWYTPERIVGHYLRELLQQIRTRETGAPIARVVATYPPSFDERLVAALRASFEHALAPFVQEDPGCVALRLDEVSAAAYAHVLDRVLRAFRELELDRRSLRVLALDWGGGTSDAVALDVELERRPRDSTRISMRLLGATGERRFGGEDVTDALVELLQRRLALAILAARAPGAADPAGASADASPLAQVLRALATRPTDEDEDEDDRRAGSSGSRRRKRSPLAATVAELAGHESPKGARSTSALDRFACRDAEGYRRALERLGAERVALARASDEALSLAQALGPGRASDAAALEDALDVVVPVRPGRKRGLEDPVREDLEKALACELRQEAERLKRRLAERPGEALAPTGELTRLARHAEVDPGLFARTVKVSLEELEAVVRPRIEAFVGRARGLLERLDGRGPATVATTGQGVAVEVDVLSISQKVRRDALGPASPAAQTRPLVLLCGNGSRLPAVRSAVQRILALGDEELAWSADRAKPLVAQGAAEEEAQRRHFGGELLLVELEGFADRLPYAIGLYHPDLRDAPGFVQGFQQLFGRGARAGESRVVGSENPLVHGALERLKLYASDLDGAVPRLLGRVDLASEPLERAEPSPAPDGSLRLRFELGPNREVRVTDLSRGTVHRVEPA